MASTERAWPGGGRLRKAAVKKSNATVVFLHHYGGSRASSHWHQAMVNDLGFDSFSFNLSDNRIPRWRGRWPENLVFHGDCVRNWTQELEAVLEALNGPKILYSFSFPSVTAPALLATRRREDVRAWICDGGPFLDMLSCQWNLFTYGEATPNLAKRGLLTAYSYLKMGGPRYTRQVHQWVAALKPELPILSLRAGRDLLVPPSAIDHFFASRRDLNLQCELFPEAGHLEGLKLFPESYVHGVERFLKKVTW